MLPRPTTAAATWGGPPVCGRHSPDDRHFRHKFIGHDDVDGASSASATTLSAARAACSVARSTTPASITAPSAQRKSGSFTWRNKLAMPQSNNRRIPTVYQLLDE